MIFKKTWVSISDNTNVRWLQIFHLYKGFHRKQTYLGFFVKGSARVVEPPRQEYKGFKFAFNLKGDICRGIISRTAYPIQRVDGSVLQFYQSCSVLIKKKTETEIKIYERSSIFNYSPRKIQINF